MNNTTSPKSRRIVSLLLTNSYNGEFFGPSCHLKAGCSNTVEIRLLRFWDNVKKGGELMTATLLFLDHLWLLIDQLHNQHIFILASLQEKKRDRVKREVVYLSKLGMGELLLPSGLHD
ncbi:hypothetical protein F2Q68_00005706 [Brassica cretica]|uniref:Uncharacterized protein n=1 Tax=Brassica cretica TaxID=69181 RepID=A0A8S9JCW6_BRACR|nr:hypothetical protein F2Q68_00005706 [Brassica cretica]